MQFFFVNAVDALAVSLFLYLLVVLNDSRRRGGLPYPPGPPRWPIIGNLLDVPKNAPWIAYSNMSKKYGDVIYLRIFSQAVVVLCSVSAAKDLLEKRGEIYSDRPTYRSWKCSTDFDWPVFFTGVNETWVNGRKLLNRSLRPAAVVSYQQMIQEKTREFLAQLRTNPKKFRDHVGRLQGKLIMSLTYGYDLKDDDRILEAPSGAAEILSPLLLPGGALVNNLPFLRHIPSWVPFLSYKPLAQTVRNLSERIRNEPIDFVKNALHNGTAAHSLAGEHLQDLDGLVGSKRQMQEDIVKEVMGSMYQAGFETTSSSITSLFLVLALVPQVQRRAQAELDLVIGRDRLPTFDDRPRLPYVEALCNELMRWHLVLPLALPHLLTKDDVYKGFFIPKGSIVLADAWAILHDPELYPDPEEFKPERYLNEDGTVRDDPILSFVFGFGKRICPGRHFVDATIFIVISSVLSVFNVTKAKDENGREIPVKATVTADRGIVILPGKFECSILPRDKVAEDLISAASLS